MGAVPSVGKHHNSGWPGDSGWHPKIWPLLSYIIIWRWVPSHYLSRCWLVDEEISNYELYPADRIIDASPQRKVESLSKLHCLFSCEFLQFFVQGPLMTFFSASPWSAVTHFHSKWLRRLCAVSNSVHLYADLHFTIVFMLQVLCIKANFQVHWGSVGSGVILW